MGRRRKERGGRKKKMGPARLATSNRLPVATLPNYGVSFLDFWFKKK
jgi:hypothetical protein